jgi:GGDEF domain-containing protein
MFITRNIFTVSAFMLTFSLLSMNFNAFTAEIEHLTPEQLISKVELFFQEDGESLNYNEVVELSNKIIIQREKYSSEILAKTYILLANVASNVGELETAFQFTQDGIAVATRDEKTNLCLQIKLASILSAKKKYKALLTTAQQAISMPKSKENSKYFLFALSYRSVAFAMLNQHENALLDLQKVESIIKSDPSFAEHTTLLAILANAYYYLGDYQTALTVQLKILKLRFNLNKLNNVDQTYYHLANAYYRLNRFNDAYNAYWEAKKYAEKKAAPIHVAYANQGLGLTLMQQKQYTKAEAKTKEASALFYQHNLARSYLETLATLARISQDTAQQDKTTSLLLEAEELTKNIELTDDYIFLYQLLAEEHKLDKDINKAYFWQQKYSDALLKINQTSFHSNFPLQNVIDKKKLANASASNRARQLSIKLAEQSELAASFSKKYQQQQTLIFILSGITLILLSLAVFLWIKSRAQRLKNTYEALEAPNNIFIEPIKTKQHYQQNFNMARKYAYSLTLGYITISNWQELTFQFNKKIVSEVSREIANLINKHIDEFDSAGLINEGEYLLFFPHQEQADAEITMEKLISALKLRFFANLGTFSVTIAYSTESPDFQDIDPYIFLSQLSDSIKIA